MKGNFGTMKVLISQTEWHDYNGIPFANEQAFRDYFDKDWFLGQFDDGETVDSLMDEGLLGYEEVEVIGS